MMKLREIAHARTGDKGDVSCISLIAYDPADYSLLVREISAARVAAWFSGVVCGNVQRYEVPALGALNFVLSRALGGGVTRSLALDTHGKCLSSCLLDMPVFEEP